MAKAGGTNGPRSQSVSIDVDGVTEQVSLTLFQTIYKKITTQQETISKSFDLDIQIKFEDVRRLNDMILQTCKQYNVQGINVSVSMFHADDYKFLFNSFEEFTKLSMGHSAPVENILLTYRLLIVPPNDEKPESYNISIRLTSRVTVQKRLYNDFPMRMPLVIARLSDNTINANIKYVDYTVARSIMTVINDWANVLPCADRSKVVEYSQKISYYFATIARVAISVICIGSFMWLLPKYVGSGNNSDSLLGEYLLCTAGTTYVFYTIANWIGHFIERSIDRWKPLSYILINKADEKEIDATKGMNKRSIWRAILGLAATFVLSIFSKVCASVMVFYLLHK